jgi:hypothetical protein
MQQSRKCDIFTTPMKFIYNIKDEQGNEQTLQAMSYKKLLKQLNNKYKEGEVIQVKYKNKKDHELLKYIKIKRVE